MNKKVLVIAYYWPPSGGSGVQRWLKFVKYLPQFGWEPYVFTPENPSFSLRDESLLNDVPNEAEVIRFPIWEPYESFSKVAGIFNRKKGGAATDVVSTTNASLFQKITTFIRANFFVPDPRVFWVRPSVKFLNDFLKDNEIRTIITTGPPHSVHLIGLKLKKNNPSLRWLADFRDPWSEWGFLDSLNVSQVARKIHRKLEADVLARADKVITITPFYVRKFEALAKRKVNLLTNGYDEDDFASLEIIPTQKFTIRHVGIINEKCDPRPFMTAVEKLLLTNSELGANLHIDFVGEVHADFKRFVLASSLLREVTTFTSSVPHKDLIMLYGKSSLLLLILTGYKDAEGYMPGKLFEYIATTLPVLGTGPSNGDAANLLRESKAGVMVEGTEQEKIQQILLDHYAAWQRGALITSKREALRYSRRSITKELIELF